MRLFLVVFTFLYPFLQPQAVSTVRMRLFSLEQPSEIRLTREGKQPERIRATGAQLTTDGRPTSSPLRIAGPSVLQPAGGEAVRVTYPIEISARNGSLLIVGSIPREDYVSGVLAGEASVFRSGESLKAMAVAARTYAVRFMGRHKNEGFDFCDTTHCQDYRGVAITARVNQAVAATSGELLWYQGAPIEAYYHQDCGGITEARSPYLRQINDTYCTARGRMQWAAEVSSAEIQSIFQLTAVRDIAVVERSQSGRAASIRIDGSKSRTLPAEAFRLELGRTLGWNRLRSDLYEVRRSGERFIFEGYGAGHGIGLCQHGAAAMGEIGRTYRQILAYYYPQSTIGTSAQAIAWLKFSSNVADLESTQSQDSALLDAVTRRMSELQQATGLRFEVRPLVRLYPTVAAYRDATGEPGWMAASTRSNIVRLQPAAALRSRGVLESTLHHELAHVLVESQAHRDVPLWFREGIVLWLTRPPIGSTSPGKANMDALEQMLARPTSEEQLRLAYRAAQEAVESLVRTRGRETVLGWVRHGLDMR